MDGMGSGGGPEVPESFFAPGELSRLLGKVGRAFREQWARILIVSLASCGIGFAWTRVCPRIYTAKANVFALPADGSSGAQKGAAGEIVGLSDGAAKVVLSQASLDQIIAKLGLVASRAVPHSDLGQLLLRAEDRLGLIKPDPDPHSTLLTQLRKAISVKVSDSSIDITVTWSNPEQARDIAQACVDQLVEARHQIELTPLESKVATLNRTAKQDDAEVQAIQKKLEDLIAQKREGVRASSVYGMQANGHFRDLPDPALSRLRQEILTQRKTIADLEEVRQKRLAELQAQLAELNATLGPRNPKVIDTRDQLRALSAQGSQVEAMKGNEQKLLAEYVRKGGNERELQETVGPLFSPELTDDPALAFEKAALANAMSEQQGLRSALLDAKLALDAAVATFKARYVEMIRPELPMRPSSPRTTLTCVASLLVGFLTALFWALAVSRTQLPAPHRDEELPEVRSDPRSGARATARVDVRAPERARPAAGKGSLQVSDPVRG